MVRSDLGFVTFMIMRTTKETTPAADLALWKEVVRYRTCADALTSIEVLTFLFTEQLSREGVFKPEEMQGFYSLIRLLTFIAKIEPNSGPMDFTE